MTAESEPVHKLEVTIEFDPATIRVLDIAIREFCKRGGGDLIHLSKHPRSDTPFIQMRVVVSSTLERLSALQDAIERFDNSFRVDLGIDD